MNETKMFHIGLSAAQGAAYAILPGDPGRVEKIAGYLDQPEFVTACREFTTWSGRLCGRKVLVTSTGIGGPSASIAVEELSQCGVKTFLRVGTCGGMQTGILAGDLIIPTGAVRMEGTTREYVPIEYPAVPDFFVTAALTAGAQKLAAHYHTGVIQSKDSFYGQHSPHTLPNGGELERKWEAWKKIGVLASEMECAALFTVAAARGARAGAVLACIWNQEREKAGMSNPENTDTSLAIRTAVEAMRMIIEDDAKR